MHMVLFSVLIYLPSCASTANSPPAGGIRGLEFPLQVQKCTFLLCLQSNRFSDCPLFPPFLKRFFLETVSFPFLKRFFERCLFFPFKAVFLTKEAYLNSTGDPRICL